MDLSELIRSIYLFIISSLFTGLVRILWEGEEPFDPEELPTKENFDMENYHD